MATAPWADLWAALMVHTPFGLVGLIYGQRLRPNMLSCASDRFPAPLSSVCPRTRLAFVEIIRISKAFLPPGACRGAKRGHDNLHFCREPALVPPPPQMPTPCAAGSRQQAPQPAALVQVLSL